MRTVPGAFVHSPQDRITCGRLGFDVDRGMERFLTGNRPHRRGFTILEAVIATGILVVAVAAITSAITAGQQQGLEARQRIVGAIASESLLAHVAAVPFDDLEDWNGYVEEPGTLAAPDSLPVDGDWSAIGRRVSVEPSSLFVEELGVLLLGRTIRVTSFSNNGRDLASVQRFVPEPAS